MKINKKVPDTYKILDEVLELSAVSSDKIEQYLKLYPKIPIYLAIDYSGALFLYAGDLKPATDEKEWELYCSYREVGVEWLENLDITWGHEDEWKETKTLIREGISL
ncbi:hypothetical protein [Vibrio phage RYC]|nr:hypothetical protein [Vibrio phage RYC]